MTPKTKLGYKVGALAKKTGLTVRTLHHYDDIGLLSPTGRTSAGHRLYDSDDVARLRQIVALRQVGLSLADIAEYMRRPGADLSSVLRRQAEFMRSRIREEERLCMRIEAVLDRGKGESGVSDEELMQGIMETIMFEKHYTQEQLDQLAERAKTVGADRIQAVQQEWADLFATLDDARKKGVSPDDSSLDELRAKARGLIAEFTGGDTGIRESLDRAVDQDRSAMYEAWGIDEEQGAYYMAVMAAG